MSFDLILLPEPVGKSWVEALADERKGTDGPPDPQAWAAIVAGVRDVVGEVTLHEDGRSHTLEHRASGITVRYRPGEATVSAPYWYVGAEAESTVRAVYRIGRVVAEVTGLAGYDRQLGVPLTEAESKVDAAAAVFDEVGFETAYLWTRDGFRVYFAGPATLADAARRLDGLVVAEESDRLTVQWHDGPEMEVTFAAGPRINAEAAEIANDYDVPEMAAFDRRFEITFDDLDEVLQEINTLIEVSADLQDLTGGYIFRSWNGEVSPPDDDGPVDSR